ncbi:Cd(II)/Pb(II)-responsive transcriptional regulator [Massilia sp. YMA4]|uniref:Cd(II)/Pb(II)-responsive transcriptional regulator n=1 Tax=Massilia sp. YMA4 TaxID=1593482 RepID=UPI000DD142B6|nr:Cd(II)/Pb(II)-responsive transcriptional regulator [Massilia sp. YMA4]AXA94143.1 Cd(II)/Pb(II)-responsive transcriptional regulator [Massilia sp. YMA4]
MRIGELAKAADCDVETVRYYERIALLPEPERTASGYRAYGAAHAERLRFIRHCRALQISLADIGTLLALQAQPAAGCDEVNALLDHQIARIQQQMAVLTSLNQQLVELRCKCGKTAAIRDCAILQDLGQSTMPSSNINAGGPVAA